MGKIALDLSVFQRRDPVTGELITIIRKGTSRQISEELNVFQECVKAHTKGFKATGDTPKERSISVRKHLAQAAKICEQIDTKEQLEKHLKEMGKV